MLFTHESNKASEAFKATFGEVVEIENEKQLVNLLYDFAYSCSVFKGKRNNKNFKHADYIALDIDSNQTIRGVAKTLERLNLMAYIGTTTSHQKAKNGEVCDRFRVILPLESRIDSEAKYRATMEYLADFFNYDIQCKDPARFYFACNKIAKIDGMPLRVVNKMQRKKNAPKNSTSVLNFNTNLLKNNNEKGKISFRTQTFLDKGSENWHIDYLIACRDLKSQGYSKDEIIDLFSNHGWILDNKHDLPQLDYVMNDDSVVFDYREEK